MVIVRIGSQLCGVSNTNGSWTRFQVLMLIGKLWLLIIQGLLVLGTQEQIVLTGGSGDLNLALISSFQATSTSSASTREGFRRILNYGTRALYPLLLGAGAESRPTTRDLSLPTEMMMPMASWSSTRPSRRSRLRLGVMEDWAVRKLFAIRPTCCLWKKKPMRKSSRLGLTHRISSRGAR